MESKSDCVILCVGIHRKDQATLEEGAPGHHSIQGDLGQAEVTGRGDS